MGNRLGRTFPSARPFTAINWAELCRPKWKTEEALNLHTAL